MVNARVKCRALMGRERERVVDRKMDMVGIDEIRSGEGKYKKWRLLLLGCCIRCRSM